MTFKKDMFNCIVEIKIYRLSIWIHVKRLRDQTWLCVYCWCQTPDDVVSPRRAQPDHTIMFDPDYNMMPQFFPQQPIYSAH